MSIVDIRFEYIHVERAADLKGVRTGVYFTLQYKDAVRKGDVIEVPFAVYINSKPEGAVGGVVRGTAVLQGDVDVENPPTPIMEQIATEAIYKALLFLHEIDAPLPFALVPIKTLTYN